VITNILKLVWVKKNVHKLIQIYPVLVIITENSEYKQVEEITLGKEPKRAWVNRIGRPKCNTCNNDMIIIDMF